MAIVLAGPMLPIELAVWFSGELLLYLEAVAGILVASGASQFRLRLQAIRERVATFGHGIWNHIAYPISPVTRWCHVALSIQ
jgi:hypothetical protein